MPDFLRLWPSAPGGLIEFDGRQLRTTQWLAVEKGDVVRVRFERWVASPVQGVAVFFREQPRGELEVAGVRAKRMLLWTDTAPRDVEVHVVKAKRGGEIGIRNVWRDLKYGSTMSGMSCAAIDSRQEPDGSLLLACSDGWGSEPNFDDLVVRVSLEPRNPG